MTTHQPKDPSNSGTATISSMSSKSSKSSMSPSSSILSSNHRQPDSTAQNASTHPQDSYYMMLAIEEAKKGIYTTRPNPAVGCVIVKDQQIVGTGYHPKAGEPHAEVFALRQAQSQSKATGATAYVTLEPCSHTGRTPPCALALIKAGISRVVIAGLDPNPKVAGRGVDILRQAGIEVSVGVACEQAEQLNLGFLKAMRTQMPYVRLKIATSLDGRTAMASGESKWITRPPAREDVQRLRALSGAIITGSQTIIDDNPSLSVRSTQLGTDVSCIPQPKVVVLDRRQRLLATQSDSNPNYADFEVLKRSSTQIYSGSDLQALLARLVKADQIYDVLVEAGAQVSASFIQAGLVDELIVYQAPCILGQSAKPMLALDIDTLANQYRFEYCSVSLVGADIKCVLTPLR